MVANPAFSSSKVVQMNPGESYPDKFVGLPNPDWDLVDLGLTPEAFFVLFYLGRWKKVLRDNNGTLRWGASQQVCTIGEACFRAAYPNSPAGVLRRKVNDAIGELVAHRIIEVQKQNPGDSFSSNNYFFLAKPEWEKPIEYQSSNVRKGRPAGITKPKARSSQDHDEASRTSQDHEQFQRSWEDHEQFQRSSQDHEFSRSSQDRQRTSQVQQRSWEDHKGIYDLNNIGFKSNTKVLNSDLITPDSNESGHSNGSAFRESDPNQQEQTQPGNPSFTEAVEEYALVQTEGSEETNGSADKTSKKEKSKRMRARDERKAKYLEPGTGTYSAPARPKWQPEAFEVWHPKYCALKQAVRGGPRSDRTEAAIAWAMLPEMFVPKDFPSESELLKALQSGWQSFDHLAWKSLAGGERCVPVPDPEVFLLGKTNRDPYWWIVESEGNSLPLPEILDALWKGWNEGCQQIQQDRQVLATPGSRKEAENAWRYLVSIKGEEAISQQVDPDKMCRFYFQAKSKAKDTPAIAKLSTFLEPDKIEFMLECLRSGSIKKAVGWQEWFNLAQSLNLVSGSTEEGGKAYVYVPDENDPSASKAILRSEMMAAYPIERLRDMLAAAESARMAKPPAPAQPQVDPQPESPPQSEAEVREDFSVDTDDDIQAEIKLYQGLYDQGAVDAIEDWWLYQIGSVVVENDRLVYVAT